MDAGLTPRRSFGWTAFAGAGMATFAALGWLACHEQTAAKHDARPTAPRPSKPAPPSSSTSSTPPGVAQDPPAKPSPSKTPTPIDGYEVVHAYPHDARSFTQGLVYDAGKLLESQGQYGESSLRLVELETGVVKKRLAIDPRYFAEGLAVLKGLVYQLTWKEQTGFVYTLDDLRPVGSFRYEGEGWGLTTDGTSLILSDGTDKLRFVEPQKFTVTKTLPVREKGLVQHELNELEWVEGEIWANVWHTERIARIDPKTGEIVRWLDLTGLSPRVEHPDAESVLNGIAYDAAKKRLFVTGKRWPKLYEIKVKPR